MSNVPYHYPPDLTTLLISTISVLVRSKPDTVGFFRACGVDERHLESLDRRARTTPNSINKYEIARTVIECVNREGDSGLRARREIVRRVVEWNDFSTSWPDKALEAQGLVAKVRAAVNEKDSFTRMSQERERERDERLRPRREAALAAQRRREARDLLRQDLGELFGMQNAQQRGLKFERLLNKIFALDGLSVRESFTLLTDTGRVGEQIDGLIEYGNQPYIVEAKWYKEPLGIGDVSSHLVRVYSRPGVHGLIVSASPFAEPAVAGCKKALGQRTIVLAELREIVLILERHGDLGEWLKQKTYRASVDHDPLAFV